MVDWVVHGKEEKRFRKLQSEYAKKLCDQARWVTEIALKILRVVFTKPPTNLLVLNNDPPCRDG